MNKFINLDKDTLISIDDISAIIISFNKMGYDKIDKFAYGDNKYYVKIYRKGLADYFFRVSFEEKSDAQDYIKTLIP